MVCLGSISCKLIPLHPYLSIHTAQACLFHVRNTMQRRCPHPRQQKKSEAVGASQFDERCSEPAGSCITSACVLLWLPVSHSHSQFEA